MAYPWTAHDILTAADLNAAISTGIVKTGLTAPTNYTPVVVQSNTPALVVQYAGWFVFELDDTVFGPLDDNRLAY